MGPRSFLQLCGFWIYYIVIIQVHFEHSLMYISCPDVTICALVCVLAKVRWHTRTDKVQKSEGIKLFYDAIGE